MVAEGTIPPDDFHASVERIVEVANDQLEIPADFSDRLDAIAAAMLVDRALLDEVANALTVDNLVLQGPPGTGKTSLARRIAKAFGVELVVATAHPEWTTYDLIGRQELRVHDGAEEMVPVNGFFTEAVIRCAGNIVRHQDDENEPQAVWLFIDELNRAHLDRAFGELFTVLGTDGGSAVDLAYQRQGNRSLAVPRRFRIVASLNSIDRQYVNTLSQALRRRFSFVTVDVPPKRPEGSEWSVDPPPGSPLAIAELPMVIKAAAERIAEKVEGHGAGENEALLKEKPEPLYELFELISELRNGDGTETPYLPIGTATLIDIVELYAAGLIHGGAEPEQRAPVLDWAAAIKLAPLFEAETLDPKLLGSFVDGLAETFRGRFGHELKVVQAAGLYAVPE